jgi:Holliday junction DNA helicase RuvA
MFYYIQGEVAQTEPYLAVIDAGGVGYACHTSLSSLQSLQKGGKARLYTFLYLREGICDLYGFVTNEELSAFKLLLGVSGVGPRAAVSILSVTGPERLALAVLSGDDKVLTAASGVGKKLAQRIVMELKDKLGKAYSNSEIVLTSSINTGASTPLGDAQSALMVLGYSASEAALALKNIQPEGLSVEGIIRAALKALAVN